MATSDTTDIDNEFVNTIRIYYPALYKKSYHDYSDRDIVKNSWIGSAKRMGDVSVDAARDWWSRLLNDYKTEKKHRDGEGRSGSNAPSKRERFHLYETMKDMLASSQFSRQTTTNYKRKLVEEELQDQQDNSCNKDNHTYKRASGRSCKKKLEIADVMQQMNTTISQIEKVVSCRKEDDAFDDLEESPNKEIGELIFCELQRMEGSEVEEKRAALLRLNILLKRSH